MIGQALSHDRVDAALGAGGSGGVFHGTDTTLGREGALKGLPAEVASDPERLARFEREAKRLGSLNHPDVAHVSTDLRDRTRARVLRQRRSLEPRALESGAGARPHPLHRARRHGALLP